MDYAEKSRKITKFIFMLFPFLFLNLLLSLVNAFFFEIEVLEISFQLVNGLFNLLLGSLVLYNGILSYKLSIIHEKKMKKFDEEFKDMEDKLIKEMKEAGLELPKVVLEKVNYRKSRITLFITAVLCFVLNLGVGIWLIYSSINDMM